MQGFSNKHFWLAAAVVVTGAISIAWYDHGGNGTGNVLQDTIPKNEKRADKTRISGDLDKHMEELEKAMENLNSQLSGKNWEKMQLDMKKQLDSLDKEKIDLQMQKALEQLQVEKARMAQMKFDKVDYEKMQVELKRALEEAKTQLDSKKIEAQMQKAVEASKIAMEQAQKVDMTKMNAEIERAIEQLTTEKMKVGEEMEKAKLNLEKAMKHDIKGELQKAQKDIEKAKLEISAYKEMLSEMEKDGLLKKDENYRVHYKDGELIINGKKQPSSVTEKYKKYFKKEDVRIQREEESGEWF